MRLGLVIAAGKMFCKADPSVRGSEIRVDRQRPLALGDASVGAAFVEVQEPQSGACCSTVRPPFEGLAQVSLGGAEPLRAVVAKIEPDKGQIDQRVPDQRLDIVWIEFESAVEVGTGLVEELVAPVLRADDLAHACHQ